MSKSKGNVVDPDNILAKYGADAMRIFILFASPPERDLDWDDSGMEGGYRFVTRLFRLFDRWTDELKKFDGQNGELTGKGLELRRMHHHTIKRFTVDIGKREHFNTAIASGMELLNFLADYQPKSDAEKSELRATLVDYLKILHPIIPHLTQEMYERLGYSEYLTNSKWPEYVDEYTASETKTIVVQVNGKLRARLEVPADIAEEELKSKALEHEKVRAALGERTVRKVIVVPGRLLNIVH